MNTTGNRRNARTSPAIITGVCMMGVLIALPLGFLALPDFVAEYALTAQQGDD
jgi:hypothetical protein